MSKQKIKSKLDEFEKRLEINGETFTRQEVLRYHRVLRHIESSVEFIVEREVLKSFTHQEYQIWNKIGGAILMKMMKDYKDPYSYARSHWPEFWEQGGIYDLWMRGEEPGRNPPL